jgi:uncharacterized protein
MRRRYRIIYLTLSLVIMVVIGRIITNDFEFLLTQFWFTSGLFLLVLLSLVDQPFFSRDSNIFINGVTGWIALLLVTIDHRDGIWWLFFVWSLYLILSSYIIMWVKTKEFSPDIPAIKFSSNLNKYIGRPESLFSAFFIWGAIQQFGMDSGEFSALLLFWIVFMIINLPGISRVIDNILDSEIKDGKEIQGILLNIISPRVAEVSFSSELPNDLVGKSVTIKADDKELGTALIIDDRIVAGRRRGRCAIINMKEQWKAISTGDNKNVEIKINKNQDELNGGDLPISVVDVGTDLGKLVINTHPDMDLQEGEVLWTIYKNETRAFYQVINAKISQQSLEEKNISQNVTVAAGHLGIWNSNECIFEPIPWVPGAGHLVYKASENTIIDIKLPAGQVEVGKVPNSNFPIHVNIEDIITHNTAIIGVTGSGKSYLAFHLIEEMANKGIKVLILDMSRQHWIHLERLDPFPITNKDGVKDWFEGEKNIGIHQFAIDDHSYPNTTCGFVEEAFKKLSETKLTAGKNEPAKLCIIFEEAHSLIPEWNQVAHKDDTNFVNRTARLILQGRKYGMGCMIITQRTANVTKTILNQCNTIFAMQSFDQTGLDFLRNYMGEEYSQAISTLPTRHAILVGKASSSARPIIFNIQDMSKRWNGDMEDKSENKSS